MESNIVGKENNIEVHFVVEFFLEGGEGESFSVNCEKDSLRNAFVLLLLTLPPLCIN